MATIKSQYLWVTPTGHVVDLRECRVTHEQVTPYLVEHIVHYSMDGRSVHEVLGQNNYEQLAWQYNAIFGKNIS